MIGLLCFVLAILASPFKSKLRLEAENAVLRHQLNVLKRRLHGGRPQIDTELRVLIRRMSVENPLWGAPRIHGDLRCGLQASHHFSRLHGKREAGKSAA